MARKVHGFALLIMSTPISHRCCLVFTRSLSLARALCLFAHSIKSIINLTKEVHLRFAIFNRSTFNWKEINKNKASHLPNRIRSHRKTKPTIKKRHNKLKWPPKRRKIAAKNRKHRIYIYIWDLLPLRANYARRERLKTNASTDKRERELEMDLCAMWVHSHHNFVLLFNAPP